MIMIQTCSLQNFINIGLLNRFFQNVNLFDLYEVFHTYYGITPFSHFKKISRNVFCMIRLTNLILAVDVRSLRSPGE